jgi:hypothetical protein
MIIARPSMYSRNDLPDPAKFCIAGIFARLNALFTRACNGFATALQRLCNGFATLCNVLLCVPASFLLWIGGAFYMSSNFLLICPPVHVPELIETHIFKQSPSRIEELVAIFARATEMEVRFWDFDAHSEAETGAGAVAGAGLTG